MADNDVQVTVGAQTDDFDSAVQKSAQTAQASLNQIQLSAEQARQIFQGLGQTASDQLNRLNTVLGTSSNAARAASVNYQQIINNTTGISQGLRSATESGQFFEGVLGVTAERTAAVRAAFEETGETAINLGLSMGQAVNGARALMDELASGRTRQATGTFARLFSEVALGNPIIAAATAGLLAFGAALYLVETRASETQAAIKDVNNTMVVMGQSGFDKAKVVAYLAELERLPGVTVQIAGAIASNVQRIGDASEATKESIGRLGVAFASINNQTPEDAVNALVKAMNGGVDGIAKFGREFDLFSTAQQQGLQDAKNSNNTYAAQGILLDALGTRVSALTSRWAELYAMRARSPSGGRFGGGRQAAIENAPLPTPQLAPSHEDQQLLDAVQKYLAVQNQVKSVQADIAELDKGIANTTDQQAKDQLTVARNAAQQQLDQLQQKGSGVDTVAQLRAQLAEQDAETQQSLSDQLKSHIAFWQNVLQTQTLTAAQRVQVEQQVANAQKSLNQSSLQDRLAEMNAEVAATQQGSQQRIAALQREADLVKSAYGEQSKQYQQVQAQINEATRQAAQQQLADKVAALDAEAAKYQSGSTQRIAVLKQETALVAQQYGEQSKQYQDALAKQLAAERQHQQQILQLKMDGVQAQQDLALLGVQDQRNAYDADVQADRLTNSQKIAQLQQFENQEYQIRQRAIQQQIALLKQSPDTNPQQLQKLNNQLLVLERQHSNQVNQIERQSVQQTRQQYQNLISPVTSAFGSIVSNSLSGNQTMAQSASQAALSIANSFINAGEEWLTNYLTNLIIGQTAQQTSADTQITTNAATAASGAYSSASSIPYIGWIIAPAAAAAALGAVLAFKGGFAVGTPSVPADMMTTVHKGEIIVPATMSDAIRSGQLSLGGPGGGGGGGGYNFGPIHVHGALSQSQGMQTGRNLLKGIRAAARDNPSLRLGA